MEATFAGNNMAIQDTTIMDICQTIALEHITLSGELGRRVDLSFTRLEGYDAALTLAGNPGWPGDREGRAILGQVLTGQATHRSPTHTEALIAALPAGMLGAPIDLHAIREQQVTGNQWLLRAYCEIYAQTKRADILQRIDAMIDGLYLPLRGHVATYPIDPAQRGAAGDGGVYGHEGDRAVAGWVVSTDIGAVFIALDGLTHAWELRPRDDLRALIDEMIARFVELDVVTLGCQTHATLSCLRGLLRWHRAQHRPDLLALVQRVFATYLAAASTEHHHNWNWFGRPAWTEPCAVVDSFEVALGLWRATGDSSYLATAQEILFSGLFRQLPNGGYTTDCCTGTGGHLHVGTSIDGTEVVWCCTMRGAEGFARAAAHSWCPAKAGGKTQGKRVHLPWQSSSVATLHNRDGVWRIRQESAYPQDGASRFVVEQAPAGGVLEIAVYAGPWVDRARATGVEAWDGDWAIVTLAAKSGAERVVDLPFTVRRQAARGVLAASHSTLRAGPVLLGLRGTGAVSSAGLSALRGVGIAAVGTPVRTASGYRTASGEILEPIGAATWVTDGSQVRVPRQVLFANG